MEQLSSIVELPLEECRQLLGRNCLGRLGVIAEGKPLIFPVNDVFDSDAVLFRTDPGTKLAGPAFGPVAFEIDGLDDVGGAAWSVVVSGVSTEINEALDPLAARLRSLPLQPWVPGDRAHWVALRAESITGRRVMRKCCSALS